MKRGLHEVEQTITCISPKYSLCSRLFYYLVLITLSYSCYTSPNSSSKLSIYNGSNNHVYADVPKEYIRWSKWHHKQLEKFLNPKAVSTAFPNTSVPVYNTPPTPTRSPMALSFITEGAVTVPLATPTNLTPFDILMLDVDNTTQVYMGNTTQSEMTYTTGVSALLATLTAIVSFITISGNLLVLLSFFVERALRTATNYFIASLAVTDLLIGIFSMNLYTLYLILGHWPLGRLSCDLWLSLDYTACLTSQYTVLIITIDRFFSVRLPAKYRNWRTDRKVSIMVAATWIIPSSVFFPTIMAWPYFNTQVLPRPLNQCYAEFANDPIFNTVFTLCYFWLTLFVMIGLYVGIYKVAVNLQKRSDEKRNRVSGLISKPTSATAGPGINNVTGNGMEINNQKHQLPKNNQPTMHSSSVAGESSGFDSDDEHQKSGSAQQKHKAKHGLNAMHTGTKGTTNFQSILPSNIAAEANKMSESISPTNNLTTKIMVQPALLEQEGKFELPKFERKPTVPQVSSKAKPKPKMKCPVHGRSSIVSLNGQGDCCRYSPASVSLYQTDGLQISSPLLTDEDSGFEANGVGLHQPLPNYLPSSPALCICSDLEEEEHEQDDTGQTLPPRTYPVPSQTSEPLTTSQPKVETQKTSGETKPRKTTTPKPVPATQDQDYQDRVMENFRRKMAALKGFPTSESHDSDYLTSSNPSSQQPSVSKSNGNTVTKSSPTNGPKIDNPRPRCATQVCLPPQHRYLNADTDDAEVESTPLWVPQPMQLGHQLSASGSIREVTCCYSHGDIEYYDDQPECLICAGQQESDTLQSSSSYADYVDAGLESGQCFCQMSDRDRKTTDWFGQIRQKFTQIPFGKAHLIILSRIRASFAKTRQSSQKAPVERGRRENRARKALRTITFILGAFVLCWTPYHVVIMIKGICDDIVNKRTCVNNILYSVTYWLCYMNSPINPFCYALANAQFKKTFLRIFHGDFRRT